MRENTILMRRGLLATAVAGMVLVPGLAAAEVISGQAKGSPGSAYGLSLAGPAPIAPLGEVSSADEEVRRTLAKGNRTGQLSVAGVDTRAAARSANAKISGLQVPLPRLSADAITAKCIGGKGRAELVNASLAGHRLTSNPAPNSRMPVELPGLGTAWVTLNKQERLPDGRLSVTGLETVLPLGPLGRQTLKTANAVCGPSSSAPVPGPGQSEPSQPQGTDLDETFGMTVVPAPKPSPVKGDLPVTG